MTVTFRLGAAELAAVGADLTEVVPAGSVELAAGPSSERLDGVELFIR